jgi:hypothetical protein
MSAYVATDNESIANLLQWKITGDESFLSEEQRYQLGLDDEAGNETTETDDDLTEEEVIQFEDYLAEAATDPNPEVAQAILNADIGDSDAAKVVQYLAYAYYNGEKTLDEAYGEALNYGIPDKLLYEAFTNLYNQTNG